MGTRYGEECKREAVRLYRSSGKGYRPLAEDLGVSPDALRQWVDRFGEDEEAVTLTAREELRKLRRENRLLREERDILRKAAADSGGRPGATRSGRSAP